ncbi:Protein RCC2 [Holothuria leucospilota]|uniref:Protein RCC2 n=1 Tax=Holothuria leucospilota TaxID=206669 RepID=A0A9Q0YI04_HOLLE|nr:Protein RCC2 [Holothuria leucospilota]
MKRLNFKGCEEKVNTCERSYVNCCRSNLRSCGKDFRKVSLSAWYAGLCLHFQAKNCTISSSKMPKGVKRGAGDSKEKRKSRKKSKHSSEKMTEPMEKIKLKPYPSVGELLFCGGTNWDMTGRWRLPKCATREGSKPPAGGRNLFGPHRLLALSGIRVRNVISGPHANHSIIITEEGKAMSWGRNEQEQLGLGHAERVDSPTLIETLKNKHIVNAACGRTHSLCLTDEGTVYAFGDNRLGQLGIGCQSGSVGTPCKIDYHGYPIVQVACGGEFSMMLDCKGNLHSFGCQEYSQLGHNSNGRFAVKGTKTSSQNITSPRKIVLYVEKMRDGTIKPLENIVMKDVVCGGNHTVAMDMQSRIFTWGFGGYGRLGHGEPRDEPVPRSLKTFEPLMSGRTASKIYAGTSYSMVVTTNGQLYFWGQTKSTGEATMYPKPIHDLSGWNIRSVGCSNSSIVIAADDSVISWGPSPTYGELGYGENASRSSTHAQKAKPLEGFHIYKVSCGMGHSLMIARDDREEDKVRLSHMPIFDPRQPHSIPGTPYVPKIEPAENQEEEKEETEETANAGDGPANGGSQTSAGPTTDTSSVEVKDAEKDTSGAMDLVKKESQTETKPEGVERGAQVENEKEKDSKLPEEVTSVTSDPSGVAKTVDSSTKVEEITQEETSTKEVLPSTKEGTESMDTLEKSHVNAVIGNGSVEKTEPFVSDNEPLNLTKETTQEEKASKEIMKLNNVPVQSPTNNDHGPEPPVTDDHSNSVQGMTGIKEEDVCAKKPQLSAKMEEVNQVQTSNGTTPVLPSV